MIRSIPLDRPVSERLLAETAVAVANPAVRQDDRPAAGAKAFRTIMGGFEDAGLLLLLALLFPLTILVLGTPIALIVRSAVEIARRFL